MNTTNPYESLPSAHAQNAATKTQRARTPEQVFLYAYCTSLPVAVTVVVIWLFLLFNDPSTPQSQKRTSPPDIVELVFLVITTLPSVFMCWLFSFSYCAAVKVPEKRKVWPPVLFGAMSGLVFNAMTAIWIIEYFFKW